MLIELSWPHKALSPNHRSRSHWPRTNAIKAARREGYWATMAAKGRFAHKPEGERFAFVVTAYPPTAHARDDDNMGAMVKAQRDGIAEALGIDDNLFDQRLQWGEPVKGGKLVIEVKPA